MGAPLVYLSRFSIDKQPLGGALGVHRHDDPALMGWVVMSFSLTRYVVKQVGTVLYL